MCRSLFTVSPWTEFVVIYLSFDCRIIFWNIVHMWMYIMPVMINKCQCWAKEGKWILFRMFVWKLIVYNIIRVFDDDLIIIINSNNYCHCKTLLDYYIPPTTITTEQHTRTIKLIMSTYRFYNDDGQWSSKIRNCCAFYFLYFVL